MKLEESWRAGSVGEGLPSSHVKGRCSGSVLWNPGVTGYEGWRVETGQS